MIETRAATAIRGYKERKARKGRTRFTPDRDVETQRDPSLPGVVFFRYPDGSSIRLDTIADENDIQEF